MASVNPAAAIILAGTPDNLAQGGAKINAHWHEYDAVLLTNRTGGGLVAGDVVRLHTSSASSVAAGDAVASHRTHFVAMATIADLATGEFARGGTVSAKSTGAIGIGEYVRKSATAYAIETTGVNEGPSTAIPDGSIGVSRAVAAAGFCLIEFFDQNWVKTNNLIAANGAGQTIQNTTTETAIVIPTGSATILAGTMNITGGVVTYEVVGVLNGVNNGNVQQVTFRFKLGATTLTTKVVVVANNIGTSTLSNEPFSIVADVSNLNATNAQRAFFRFLGREAKNPAPTAEVTPVVVRGAATENSANALLLAMSVQFNNADASNYCLIERVRVTQSPT